MTRSQEKILLCKPHLSGNEMKFIEDAFAESWVVPLGPDVDAFQSELEKYLECGSRHVVALSAGTAAIHLGLVMLGVRAGDEVICQSFTFSASANPIVYQGAVPVFVDSEPDSWNMSPELTEQAIIDRKKVTGKYPKAIVVAHLYGMPANIDEICRIASKYGIPVLEDAAEALGSNYKGKACGLWGDYAALSFNGNKMITTSGGGALIVPDEEAKKRTIFYATQAREPFPYYQHTKIGYNYRMSNISACIGRGQMTILPTHLAHHRHIHEMYVKLFASMPGIKVQCNPNGNYDSNFWLSNILIDPEKSNGVTYEDLRQHLATLNIESRPLWKPLHLQPVFEKCPAYVNGVSENLFNHGLCLPSGPWVSDSDVQFIAQTIIDKINGLYIK